MQGLRHMLLQEQRHLQEIADKAQTGLTAVPEGHLRISKDKNKPRYYQCIDDNNGIYIPRSNKELPKLLAQKTYNRIVVKKAETRLKQMEKILQDYTDDEIERIYTSMHKERQLLVTPIEPTWNQLLMKWYEEEYCSRCPKWSNQADSRTEEMKFWWDYLMSRDIGGKILERIISVRDIVSKMFGERKLPKEHNGKIVLYNDVNFGRDSLMCEWAYCVNFQTKKLECFCGFNKDKSREYKRFATNQEEVDEEQKNFPNRYYGIYLVKEYDLYNLPETEEFVKELYELTKEGDEDDE